MQITGTIRPDNLMSLEQYDRWRQQHRAELIAHRRLRSVAVGAHMTVQFEDERTLRYQIQEMLRVEKVFDAAGIESEVGAYAPLLPSGCNWKATLLLEYPNPAERHAALRQLIGIEDHMFVAVAGLPPVYAIADEDLVRETAEKTAAVHFLRWEFDSQMCAAIQHAAAHPDADAAVLLGCDLPHYQAQAAFSPNTLASLAQDLR